MRSCNAWLEGSYSRSFIFLLSCRSSDCLRTQLVTCCISILQLPIMDCKQLADNYLPSRNWWGLLQQNASTSELDYRQPDPIFLYSRFVQPPNLPAKPATQHPLEIIIKPPAPTLQLVHSLKIELGWSEAKNSWSVCCLRPWLDQQPGRQKQNHSRIYAYFTISKELH